MLWRTNHIMNSKKLIIRIYPKSLFISILIFSLPFCFLLEINTQIPLVAYWDELLTVIAVVYCCYLGFRKKLQRIEIVSLILFLIVIIIGVLSNFIYQVTTDISSIGIDIVALLKISVPFFVAKYLAIEDKDRNIARYLLPFSKLFIISAFLFGTISLFVDIGMSGSERYGIPSFYFITNNEGRLGLIVASLLLIILMVEQNKKKQLFYEFCSILVMIYTTKGTIYIIFIVYLILLIMWRKSYKLTTGNIIILIIGILSSSIYQIRNYLTDMNSPRMLFFKYGFITANEYFPFGSGFSTFGSAEAAKNYSPLYYLYGFNKIWGLNPVENMFLNDCYLAMILGQFGYFGLLLFLLAMLIIFTSINKCFYENKKSKALAFGLFIALAVSTIGSAIMKSSIGVFCLVIIGLFAGYSQSYNKLENMN